MGVLCCKSHDAVTCCEAIRIACGGAQDQETITPEKPVKLHVFTFNDLETATNGFSKEALLGKASYGSLYKGTLKDGRLVAVKRQEFLEDENAFENELEILSTLHSDCFVNLVGFSKDSDIHEKLLVVDFMPNGNLYDILHHCPEPLAWNMRAHLALQIARAINALHSALPPVIHRDIKSANILLDARWNAKLGDFGLALRGHMEDVLKHPAPPAGTIGYIDPSYETPRRVSRKTDVFSFGVLLLELISGREAMDARYKPPHIIDWALPLLKQGKIHAVFDPKLRVPPQDAKALKSMVELAARCVRRATQKRPSMAYIAAELKDICARVPLPKWIGLARVIKTAHLQSPESPASRKVGHLKNSNKCNAGGRESPRIDATSARIRVPHDGNKDSFQNLHSPAKDPFGDSSRDLMSAVEGTRESLTTTAREYPSTGGREYPPSKDFSRAYEGHSQRHSESRDSSFRKLRGDVKDLIRDHTREQSRSRPTSRAPSREHSGPISREQSKEWVRDHSRVDQQGRATDLPRELTREVVEASLNHIRKWRNCPYDHSKEAKANDKFPWEQQRREASSSTIATAAVPQTLPSRPAHRRNKSDGSIGFKPEDMPLKDVEGPTNLKKRSSSGRVSKRFLLRAKDLVKEHS